MNEAGKQKLEKALKIAGEIVSDPNRNPSDEVLCLALAFISLTNARLSRSIHAEVMIEDEAVANARLIAAAPELLNMLQQARTMLKAYGSDYDPCHVALMADIDAALAKPIISSQSKDAT
jgi:hypothetical protein